MKSASTYNRMAWNAQECGRWAMADRFLEKAAKARRIARKKRLAAERREKQVRKEFGI